MLNFVVIIITAAAIIYMIVYVFVIRFAVDEQQFPLVNLIFNTIFNGLCGVYLGFLGVLLGAFAVMANFETPGGKYVKVDQKEEPVRESDADKQVHIEESSESSEVPQSKLQRALPNIPQKVIHYYL